MLSLCEPFEILLAPLVLTVATRVPEVLEMDDFTDVCAKVKRNKHAYHTSYHWREPYYGVCDPMKSIQKPI